MAVPTPHTWTAGDDATSVNLQTVTDAALYLLGSATSTGAKKPLCVLRQSVAQSLANNAFTSITFDVEDVDYDNGHSTSSNTSRYTAQTAGWYLASGAVSFTGNATGGRLVQLAVNGSAVNGTEVGFGTVPNSGHLELVTAAKLVYLNVNDYLELQAWQTSGAGLNTFLSGAVFPMLNLEWRSN